MDRSTKNLKNIESIEIKTSTGNTMRVLFDKVTKETMLIVDHEILRTCPQDAKMMPYLDIDSFYMD